LPTVAEALSAPPPLSSDLRAGLQTLSANQEITFTQYIKLILPLDGFVFWVKSDLISKEAAYNATGWNTVPFNNAPANAPATTIQAMGSLHFASDKIQDETESYGLNKVTFTSEEPLHQDFNKIGNNLIYIGEYKSIKFAFANRENFYQQADLWHYIGDAIYPLMESQIIDDASQINFRTPIVSNSLPLWLRLNNYSPNFPAYGFGNTTLPLYPSHLVSPNTTPPFASVHIYPESTEGIASTPRIGFRSSHHQLCKERVKITMYGLGNDYAMTFVDCVNQYSQDYDYFGITNVPVIRDEKISQNELGIIAQKKSIEYSITYWQNSVRNVARQIISQAIPTIITVPFGNPTEPPTFGPDGQLDLSNPDNSGLTEVLIQV